MIGCELALAVKSLSVLNLGAVTFASYVAETPLPVYIVILIDRIDHRQRNSNGVPRLYGIGNSVPETTVSVRGLIDAPGARWHRPRSAAA